MKKLIFCVLLFYSIPSYTQLHSQNFEAGISSLYAYRILVNGNSSPSTEQIIMVRDHFETPMASFGFFAGYNSLLSKRIFGGVRLNYRRQGYATRIDFKDQAFYQSAGASFPIPSSYQSITHYDIYNTLSVNILAGYIFIKKERYNFFVNGGILVDFMATTRMKTIVKSDNGKKTTSRPDPFFNSKLANRSFNFGFGSCIKLNELSGIKFDIEIYRNIGDFNTNPVRLRLAYTALNIGYTHKIGKN